MMVKIQSSICFSIFIFIILLLSDQSIWAVSGAIRCHPQDMKVLLKIKNDLGNPYVLTCWNPQIVKDCCDWCSIYCDLETNRITGLFISNSNLSAQIPLSVVDLPYLDNLRFHKLPNLIGNIPHIITNLTHLKYLDISWTNISGPIPDFLSQLNNLNDLDLSFNNLTGTIPSSLSELSNLTYLNLHGNKLTGSIPDSFGNFKGNPSPYLILSHNQLTGNVPKSLADLKFPVLDLSRNNLQGDISFFFAPDKDLQSHDFSRNMFEFDLSKVVFPNTLTSLDLNHNKIYGSLPQGLTSLNLEYLNVSYNRLCGEIPVGGNLQTFETTSYFHNRCLCGAPLPPCKL
ncbi:polygalacturonase inhibitor-like [Impatiens glandulifera]|uniref:polygalacturonase inhibitor-like n=1 Tax=Impatiens glandulifera TaxID=253017 RepID=UPI001FB12D04|nr:polygalacturonase inhibitor-like [Impatiens glandulifera]